MHGCSFQRQSHCSRCSRALVYRQSSRRVTKITDRVHGLTPMSNGRPLSNSRPSNSRPTVRMTLPQCRTVILGDYSTGDPIFPGFKMFNGSKANCRCTPVHSGGYREMHACTREMHACEACISRVSLTLIERMTLTAASPCSICRSGWSVQLR